MNTLNPQTRIGELVAEDYRSAAVFKKHKIDFCCNGGRSIAEACEKKNIDTQALINELNDALKDASAEKIEFNSWPADLLIDYILKKHHRYVEERIPILQEFLTKLVSVHGHHYKELLEIKAEFDEAAKALGAHMKKEEIILFPYVQKMVLIQAAKTTLQPAPFGTVENPIHMMHHEHDTEGERFRKIEKLSNDYTPPAEACNTYRVAYAMLKEFQEDLHQHIHLENNILFPKALQLEEQLAVA